jgi:cytoskeletal protein CcmA (bactofilin family)
MREERGKLSGKQIVSEPLDMWGTVVGDVIVVAGGRLYVRGAIYGKLTIAPGGRCHVFGNISGSLTVETDAKVILSGTVGGDAINNGGRLYIDAGAKVIGKVRYNDGETKIDSKAKVH